jgi:hypothetical protein
MKVLFCTVRTCVLSASLGLNSSSSWLIAMKSPTGSSLSPLTTCTNTLKVRNAMRERKEGR